MTKLAFFARPLVAFDPANKDHRRYYAEYLEYGGWGKSPVQFICPEDHGDLITMMQRALVAWYTVDEFGSKKKVSKVKNRLDK